MGQQKLVLSSDALTSEVLTHLGSNGFAVDTDTHWFIFQCMTPPEGMHQGCLVPFHASEMGPDGLRLLADWGGNLVQRTPDLLVFVRPEPEVLPDNVIRLFPDADDDPAFPDDPPRAD